MEPSRSFVAARQVTLWSLLAVVVLAGCLGVAFVGPADAAPPPRPVCAGCGDAIEDRATDHGLDLTVTNSTATVTVSENGSAVWVVTNTIREQAAIDRLRQNGTLRSSIVDVRYWDVTLLSTSMTEEGVLTARYREPDFAAPATGGTLRSGSFTHDYGYRNLEGLGADRLVVVAPDGMRIEATVPGATRTDNGSRMVMAEYDRGGFVTFVPDDAPLGFLWSWAAIAAVLGPVVAVNTVVSVVVPTALVTALVAASGRFLRTVQTMYESLHADVTQLLTLAGTTGVTVAILGSSLGLFGVDGTLLLGVSVVAVVSGLAWARLSTLQLTYRTTLAASMCALGAAVVATLAGSILFYGRVQWYGLGPRLPLLVALFALVPAGFATVRGARWTAILTAGVGVIVALVATAPLTSQFWMFGLVARLLFAIAGAVSLAVLGVPFLVVGALAAGDAGERAIDTHS
ncbi:hypothetical protein [Salinibaculum rarum]|uniref:hypothetical protein n=1 Tax=Salinibaculum rarum TaxID=3058903 RepID=UPI00265E3A02|nr:hypothetical protein [Salinibaculum sp. KK48]